MAETSPQPNPADAAVNADATSGGGGKGGKKDYKKIIIASAIILVVGGTAAFMSWGFVLSILAQFTGDPSNASNGGVCQGAFDTSKLALYEAKTPQGAEYTAKWTQSDEAKSYATGTLGISESDIRQYTKPEVENMMRAEVAVQFSALGLDKIAKVENAQSAVMTYQQHESGAWQLFTADGKPSYSGGSGFRQSTNILSLTNDKFFAGSYHGSDDPGAVFLKNKRTAGSYDIHYTIYLGVKEILSKYKGINNPNPNELERWKQTLTAVCTPATFWNRGIETTWNEYVSTETPYVCTPGVGGGSPSGPGYNNVPVFKQTDPRWATHPYNPQGVTGRFLGVPRGGSGCGPTSAAMVLKFYGKDVDPVIVADWSVAHGHRANEGTAYSLFPAIAKAYGLKEEDIGWDAAAKVLQQGKPLIVSMNSTKVPNSMPSANKNIYNAFTSDGHFIVLTGISGNTVYINDPGPRGILSASVANIKAAFEAGYYYIHP